MLGGEVGSESRLAAGSKVSCVDLAVNSEDSVDERAFMPHELNRPFALQLLRTLESVATASEPFNFSA